MLWNSIITISSHSLLSELPTSPHIAKAKKFQHVYRHRRTAGEIASVYVLLAADIWQIFKFLRIGVLALSGLSIFHEVDHIDGLDGLGKVVNGFNFSHLAIVL